MLNKEAAVYFRNKQLEGKGLEEVDVVQFAKACGVGYEIPTSDPVEEPADKPEIPSKIFEIFDGREWKRINPYELEIGQKVVRISLPETK